VLNGPLHADDLLVGSRPGRAVGPRDHHKALHPAVSGGEDESAGYEGAPALVLFAEAQLDLPGNGAVGRLLAADDARLPVGRPGDGAAAARVRREFGEAPAARRQEGQRRRGANEDDGSR
jgi:hypothetical protein